MSVNPSIRFDEERYTDDAYGTVPLIPLNPVSINNVTKEIGVNPASQTASGVVNTGNQTLAGTKTFVAIPKSSAVPTDPEDLTNKAYVDGLMSSGVSWKAAVLAFHDFTSPPADIQDGDRYISLTTVGDYVADYLYQYETNAWVEYVPAESWACYVAGGTLHSNTCVLYNGTDWISLGSSILHQSLIGAGTITHETIDHRLATTTNIEEYGAVGDGVTDDKTAIESALTACNGNPVIGDASKNYLVSSLDNDLGYVVKNTMVNINEFPQHSIAHDELCFNTETLYAFYQKLVDRTDVKIVFCGDSTTAGAGGGNRSDRVDTLFTHLCHNDGLTNVLSINRGISGASAYDWQLTHVATDIAQNGDLYVVRYGINDLNQDYSYEDIAANIRSGLSQLRTAYGILSGVGIVLMTPLSCHKTYKCSEFGNEQLSRIFRQAAIDYDCAFFDTYAFFQNCRSIAQSWFSDTPRIHPIPIYYYSMVSKLYQMIIPKYPINIFNNKTPKTEVAVTVPTATNMTFYMSGKTLLADWSASGRTDFYYAGTKPYIDNSYLITPQYAAIEYHTDALVDGGNQGCIRFKYVPLYNGLGFVDNMIKFGEYLYLANIIKLRHHSLFGYLRLDLYNSSGVSVISQTLGQWSAVQNQEYEFEINWNASGGATRVFIDGVQYGDTITNVYTRTVSAVGGRITLGSGSSPQLKFRNLQIFSTVQHTENYTVSTNSKAVMTNNSLTIDNCISADTSSVHILPTTLSTAQGVGALVVDGGASFQGNIRAGDALLGKVMMTSDTRVSNMEIDPANGNITFESYTGVTGAVCLIPFHKSTFAYYHPSGVYPEPISVGTGTITGGKWVATSSDDSYLRWAVNNTALDPGNVGAIKFKYTPNYTGAPSTVRGLFSWGNLTTTKSIIRIWHAASGNLGIYMTDHNNNVIFPGGGMGAWSPTSGTEYEMEFNWSIAGGSCTYYMYINGTRLNTGTNAMAYTRSTKAPYFQIGGIVYNTLASTTNGSFRDVIIYSAVQHTGASYTPGYELTGAVSGDTNQTLKTNDLMVRYDSDDTKNIRIRVNTAGQTYINTGKTNRNSIERTYAFGDDTNNGTYKFNNETLSNALTIGYDPINGAQVIEAYEAAVGSNNLLLLPTGGTTMMGGDLTFWKASGINMIGRFATSLNLDRSAGQNLTGSTTGTVAIVNSKMKLNAASRIVFTSYDEGNVMTLKFLYTPHYTTNPLAETIFEFGVGGAANHLLLGRISTNVYLICRNSSGTQIWNTNFTTNWTPIINIENEFMFCLNATAGRANLFINGIKQTTLSATSFNRNGSTVLTIGSTGNPESFSIRKLVQYPTEKETANYTDNSNYNLSNVTISRTDMDVIELKTDTKTLSSNNLTTDVVTINQKYRMTDELEVEHLTNLKGNCRVTGSLSLFSFDEENFTSYLRALNGDLNIGCLVDNQTNILSTKEATSTTSGALVVTGGLAVGKKSYLNGEVNANGVVNLNGQVNLNEVVNFNDDTGITGKGTGSTFFSGGVQLLKGAWLEQSLYLAYQYGAGYGHTLSCDNNNNLEIYSPTNTSTIITSTKQSTSTDSGAVILSGGIGIAKNAYVGGAVNCLTLAVGSKNIAVDDAQNEIIWSGAATLGATTYFRKINDVITFSQAYASTPLINSGQVFTCIAGSIPTVFLPAATHTFPIVVSGGKMGILEIHVDGSMQISLTEGGGFTDNPVGFGYGVTYKGLYSA